MFSVSELMTFSNSERSFFEDNLLDADDWGKDNAATAVDVTVVDASPTSSSSDSDQHGDLDFSSIWLHSDDIDTWLQDELELFVPQDNVSIKPEPLSPATQTIIKNEPISPKSTVTAITDCVTSTTTTAPVKVNVNEKSAASRNINKMITSCSSVNAVKSAINMNNTSTSYKDSFKRTSNKVIKVSAAPVHPNIVHIKGFKPVAVKSEPQKILLSRSINPCTTMAGKTNAFTAPKIVKLENGQFYVAKSVIKPTAINNLNNNIQYNAKPGSKRQSDIKTEHLLPPPQDLAELKTYKRQQRMMKNRESACLSRQRKKQHVQTLEVRVSEVNARNQLLKEENEKLKQRIQALESENSELRDKPMLISGLKENAKKSTLLFALILLFIFNPFSYTWNAPEMSSSPKISPFTFHRSRSLLQYDNSNINNFDSMYRNNVIGSSKIRFGESSNFFRMEEKKEKLKRKIRKQEQAFKPSVSSTDGDIDCGEQFNKTDLSRINEALEGLVKGLHKEKKQKKKMLKLKPSARNMPSGNSTSERGLMSSTNCNQSTPSPRTVTSPYLKFLRHERYRKAYPPNRIAAVNNTSNELSIAIQKSIDRKADTFYVVSLLKDYLILPATSYNYTQRPKVSFMLPAFDPNNDTALKDTGKLPMLQIDCAVIDTKLISVNRNSVSKFS